MMKADPARDDVRESLIRIIIDVGMERRDVASDIADALMSRDDSPLVRYRDRDERNAKMYRDLCSIVDSWCDLQIAHPGCLPDAKALKARINGKQP